MTVPYSFGSATSAIPLSQLDSNFNTPITLGNTAIQLGNTVTTLNNMTLANVTISSGTVTLTSVNVTNANVTSTLTLSGLTASTALALDASKNVVSVTNTGTGNNVLATSPTMSGVTLSDGTANGVAYLNGSKVVTTGSALMFDGTNFRLSTGGIIGIYDGSSNNRINLGADASGAYIQSTYSSGGTTDLRFLQASTESMRLTSTGLGIGTSSPGYKLNVSGNGYLLGLNGGGTNRVAQTFGNTGGGLDLGIEGSAGGTVFTGGSSYAGVIGTNNATVLQLGTNGTIRATIDSSGNLLVGTTSQNGAGGFSLSPSATAPELMVKGSATTNASTTYELYSTGASAYRFYVGMGGTIYATSTTITGISDQRLKENIRDLDDGLEKIMALKPRKFDWKEGKGAGTKDARGFIAQEFETVFPDMIEEWRDEAPEGEEPYKAVNANLIPTLVKAIQEQQAIIQTLTTRIEALEGK